MSKFKKIFTAALLLISASMFFGCTKYSDYTKAYSDHVINDRSRIDKSLNQVDETFTRSLEAISDTPDYIVELTLYDKAGNEVPLKIKDSSKTYLIAELNRGTNERIKDVSRPTPFTLEAPITMESVAIKTVEQTPFVTMMHLGVVGMKNAGTHTTSTGSSTAATDSFNGNDQSSSTEIPFIPEEE